MSNTPRVEKRYGLLLTLGGAAQGHYSVVGVPGLFHPVIPTPVGEAGDPVSLADARKADRAAGVDLRLVEIPTAEVEQAEDFYKQVVENQRTGAPTPLPQRRK